MKNLFLLSLLIVSILSQTVTVPALCASDSDCNYSSTFGLNYCNNSTCLPRTSIAYKAAYGSDNTKACQSSFRVGGICSSFSTANCPSSPVFVNCLNSFVNGTTCQAYTNIVFTQVYFYFINFENSERDVTHLFHHHYCVNLERNVSKKFVERSSNLATTAI